MNVDVVEATCCDDFSRFGEFLKQMTKFLHFYSAEKCSFQIIDNINLFMRYLLFIFVQKDRLFVRIQKIIYLPMVLSGKKEKLSP